MGRVLVTYTTLYRGGKDKFKRCAETKADELTRLGYEVECVPTETKADFVEALTAGGGKLERLHFFGHSGLYGIMFGTTAWPEQLSPFEWRELENPFAKNAQAYFHACRTARWFAPFIAQTFGIASYGFSLYTTFSRKPTSFSLSRSAQDPLYMVSVPGKKSHGVLGSLAKYSGIAGVRPMERFEPRDDRGTETYDEVAELYDQAYADIRVRRDEYKWMKEEIPKQARVCDLGCGNGALLQALHQEERVSYGIGLDESSAMLAHAKRRAAQSPALSFSQISGPKLPLADGSIDVVTSMLSFRYLDWDPILAEIQRVLTPEGRLLIVDMVESPANLQEFPSAVKDRLGILARRKAEAGFQSNLERLVRSKEWSAMLAHNPMRAEHEYRWYLGSRFPMGSFKTLNVGLHAKIIAFDSGPVAAAKLRPTQYP